jgi:hypothetical protein
MPKTSVRFTSYPRTEPPPQFIPSIVEAFRVSAHLKPRKSGLPSPRLLPRSLPGLVLNEEPAGARRPS